MSMNAYHAEIRDGLQKLVREKNLQIDEHGFSYIGTTKPVYFIKAADLRKLYKDFARRHPDLTKEELINLLDSMSEGETYNEYAATGLLLEAFPKQRATLDPGLLDRWLDRAEGWAEVDVICQLSFTAREMLSSWEAWKATLNALAKSENIHKRRASLVLLVKPLRESDDPRLAEMAFATVEKLKGEKGILITKAVSWVLRTLIKHHRGEVETYLDEHAATLPKVAVRETRNKLREVVN